MRREMMTFNELQQVSSVKEKQDRSKDRALWHSKKPADGTKLDVIVRTCCFLLLRYDVNQSMTFPPRPYDFLNRCRSVLWSSSVSIAMLPVSSADSTSEKTLRTAVSVE